MSKLTLPSVGGEALLEGIMMKGPERSAMVIRRPDGSLYTEEWENKKPGWVSRVPLVRGIVNFITMMITSYRCLMKSAEISTEGLDEEPESKFERFLTEKLGDKLTGVITSVAAVLGIVLAVGLFFLLPAWVMSFFKGNLPPMLLSLCEGLIKMAVFIAYLFLVSRLPDMRRLFQYHGAEHKTIACFEKRLPLTVENIRPCRRFHPRCGTSFLFIVLFISILVSSVVTWDSIAVRTALKLLTLPVVVGISYELIRLMGKYDNRLTRILAFPGLQIQRLTTREPDDDQIEIAIRAVTPAIPEEYR